ncbi:MAG: hypothetical protein ACOYJI_01435 [Anaerovoracaceae bacterium]
MKETEEKEKDIVGNSMLYGVTIGCCIGLMLTSIAGYAALAFGAGAGVLGGAVFGAIYEYNHKGTTDKKDSAEKSE